MRGLYELKEMLCRELEEISQKNDLSAGDLETAHKLTDTIKNIDKIEMLDEGGYSERGYSRDGGNSYANRGEHYVRGHYSRDGGSSSRVGRGYSRNSYSGHSGIMEQMERLLDEADSEKEREAIQRCMRQMENI